MMKSRRDVLKKIGLGTGIGMVAPGSMLASNSELPAHHEENELKGKVAIVTGARNNLGRGFAVALAGLGVNIVVHHHTPDTRDQAEETARLVEGQGAKAAIVVGDLGKLQNITKMFDTAENEFGRVDILVNNAGQIVKKPLSEVTEEEYDRLANINSKGTFFCMREASRRLSDYGRVINIGTSLFAAITPFTQVQKQVWKNMQEH